MQIEVANKPKVNVPRLDTPLFPAVNKTSDNAIYTRRRLINKGSLLFAYVAMAFGLFWLG